ncbi:MinD/ParA family protein [Mycetocola lacteus]|uniref:MinD/ParA family protein n=1 Tax=Mycetocola lacteus TaxID=76637 RepID=A0A3L7AS55_9MICO|nr:MinD/ParA family protein [Mycetocola lacteus]
MEAEYEEVDDEHTNSPVDDIAAAETDTPDGLDPAADVESDTDTITASEPGPAESLAAPSADAEPTDESQDMTNPSDRTSADTTTDRASATGVTTRTGQQSTVRPTGEIPVPVSSAVVSAARPGGIQQQGKVAGPESAALLTADRLLETRPSSRPAPEGFWQHLLYSASGHLINVGDAKAVRERKDLDTKIGRSLGGEARFVPVLTRKGGVGKTTVTALLGMALADSRSDRVIAVDANPDRGTLAERIAHQSRYTVRDVVRDAENIVGYNEFSDLVARDETRLDVLASDTDPHLSEAFNEDDYNVVADLAARYYSLILTDCGTGIVHSVMKATLGRADSIIIVTGGSVDDAKLASETLSWLEVNGHEELVRNAVVVVNAPTPNSRLVKIEEIDRHFASRVRALVHLPYDPRLAAGSAIDFANLAPETRLAARQLAAAVVEGLPSGRENHR